MSVLDQLFSAVAEAVLSYALDRLDPLDRVRQWLKRDPATLAYQKALARTYTAFARQYPDLTASLFDQSFLAKEAASELAKQLTRHGHPDPAYLAGLWVHSFLPRLSPGGDAGLRDKLIAQHMQPAAEFLHLLEANLKAEPFFQPLFDSRALESLPKIEAQIGRLTEELQRTFQEALDAARRRQTIVNRSGGIDIRAQRVDFAGDVIGRDYIVTNVYNNYFSDSFTSLSDYYIPPDSVFQRVRVERFVGRGWLTTKLDAFLADRAQPSGVFLLVGEAGVGKTAFMAHLVHERRYLHLFADQVRGGDNLPRALQSLGAQLISRYEIDPYKSRDTLTQLSAFPDFLERLLRLAAKALTTGEKIVIVCDALDEAGVAANGNAFGLPKVLPDGVYLVLAQRPVGVPLSVESKFLRVDLRPGDAENLKDIEAYLRDVAREPTVAGQLRARGYDEGAFVQALKEKSGGNWMYLRYVLEEVRRGERAPLDLSALPNGLVGYYAEYWGDWRDGKNGRGEGRDKWNRVYASLLATLAAAQEPLSADRVGAWANLDVPAGEIKQLLGEAWSAFISEREIDGCACYEPYHASLRDFVNGSVERANLPPASAYLLKDLNQCARQAHVRIVESYSKQCGGDWPKLVEQDYPRRHLVTHLAGAGQHEDMFTLVAMSNAWAQARYEKEESYAGYLTDLEQAWRWTKSDEGWNVGRQLRCALIESSIRTLAGNILPELLAQLVEAGLWSPARALAHVPHILDSRQRAEALEKLAPMLPGELHIEALAVTRGIENESARVRALSALAGHVPEALREALAVAQGIENESERVLALSALVAHLAAVPQVEALAVARGIENESVRARALSGLAEHLPEVLQGEALAVAREIRSESARARALSGLAERLPEDLQAVALAAAWRIENESERVVALSALAGHLPEALREALAAAQGIENESARAVALSRLAEHLPEALQGEALAAARRIENESERAVALSRLAEHLPEALQAEALAVARGIRSEPARARALSGLAGHLPEALQGEALAAARGIRGERERAVALSGLAGHLPEALQGEALAAARGIRGESARAQALSGLAGHLSEALQVEALAVARGIRSKSARSRALSRLAVHQPQALREALAAARGIVDESARAQVLSALAEHLPEALQAEALEEALAAARGIENESARARALSGLAEHLPETLQADALAVAQGIENESERAVALSGLVGHLPEALQAEVLAAARGIRSKSARAWALIALAEHLPEALQGEALAVARGIENESERAVALSRLAEHLPEALQGETLIVAREIRNESARAWALSRVAEHLPEALQGEALREAWRIEDESVRAWAFSGLAGHLPEALQAEALEAARRIGNESARAVALSGLAGHLPEALQVEALAAAWGLADGSARAWTLSRLAEHLSEALQVEALAAARRIENESERAVALSGLVGHLPEALQAEALTAVRRIENESARAWALSRLAGHLPEALQVEALAVARGIENESERAVALSGLAGHLPEALRAEVAVEAFTLIGIADPIWETQRADLFKQVVSAWSSLDFSGARPLWSDALHSLAHYRRAPLLHDLAALVPLIEYLGGKQAVEETFRAVRDVCQWWP